MTATGLLVLAAALFVLIGTGSALALQAFLR
jgi:hypothetical protein